MALRYVHHVLDDAKFILATQGTVTVSLRVRPGAAHTDWGEQMSDGSWKIDVKAVPEEGKANAELIRFLAKEFGVSRGNVEVLSGAGARKKLVRIVNK